ncbi:MAG: bifunctional methylenetetrahydrofolate dehydrogenase/methenyltetrahydrofolate cyclohydrolase FolD [Alphaproteobacteria bacterium]|nr:bifunctional methylenetetrahydrofolate dehydrogenase/methenyltetrahydrofolate cyclohydrolase FolD [Alphaproteobacteria bacterium]
MTATRIDGKSFAEHLRTQVAEGVLQLRASLGVKPGLAVVLVGADPASEIYVKNKHKSTLEVGMESFEHRLPADTSEDTLLALVDKLNGDDAVNGILVQLPLPKHIDETKVINRISPEKDVDGFHILNSGKLATGQTDGMVPCTPLGCLLLLKEYAGGLAGKNAVVLGRSNIVGKPMAALLLGESCTVTIAHSKTKDLPALCRTADILVAAVGRPEMVKKDWVKEGAVVIDVGINRLPPEREGQKGRVVGDVAFDEVAEVASAITPVPGGVGPMTIAVLLYNTLKATCQKHNVPFTL